MEVSHPYIMSCITVAVVKGLQRLPGERLPLDIIIQCIMVAVVKRIEMANKPLEIAMHSILTTAK